MRPSILDLLAGVPDDSTEVTRPCNRRCEASGVCLFHRDIEGPWCRSKRVEPAEKTLQLALLDQAVIGSPSVSE